MYLIVVNLPCVMARVAELCKWCFQLCNCCLAIPLALSSKLKSMMCHHPIWFLNGDPICVTKFMDVESHWCWFQTKVYSTHVDLEAFGSFVPWWKHPKQNVFSHSDAMPQHSRILIRQAKSHYNPSDWMCSWIKWLSNNPLLCNCLSHFQVNCFVALLRKWNGGRRCHASLHLMSYLSWKKLRNIGIDSYETLLDEISHSLSHLPQSSRILITQAKSQWIAIPINWMNPHGFGSFCHPYFLWFVDACCLQGCSGACLIVVKFVVVHRFIMVSILL